MSGASRHSLSWFLGRFPALQRIRFHTPRGRVPVVRQLTATECGVTCLLMVLAYHGRELSHEELRAAMGSARSGTSALALLDAGRHFGLRGRGVRIELEDLEYLDCGTILHWGFNHFVVFEHCSRAKGYVDIVDPALGRRRVPLHTFRQTFTGVALLFEPGENFTPEQRAQPMLWRSLKHVLAHTISWTRIAITSLLLQLSALALPIVTGALVDRVVPRSDHHLLWVILVGLLFLCCFNALAMIVRGHLLLHLRTQLDVRMTLGFLDHLVSLPYAFFQQRSAGDLMMRLNSNTTIREILTTGTISSLLDGALVSIYLLLLLLVDPAMGALVAMLAALQLAIFLFLRQRQRELLAQELEAQAQVQNYEIELLTGIETLKALGCEEHAVEHWSALFVRGLNVTLQRSALTALLDAGVGTIRLAAPLVILALGAYRVLDGHLSLGSMLSISALAGGFLSPLASLITAAGQLQLLRSYQERIDDVLYAPAEQEPQLGQPTPTLRGEIRLDRVSLRYGRRAALCVREVSVHIKPGQFVAVVGRSGAGKSSLAGLLLGLHSPTSGHVFYDGVDLHSLELRALRRQLGIVTQQPALFGATIRQNICLGSPDADLDAVIAAAQRARIHDEIVAMPMQYETLLVDRGASLSGGQRQRIALARALLRQPAILLLDEATSALDALTEYSVQAELRQLSCTRIVIAHRLSTVVEADLILVMEGGELVEQGRHEELLAGGRLYARLVAGQLQGDPIIAGLPAEVAYD